MALGGFDCRNCNCQSGEEWEMRHGDLVVRTTTCPGQLTQPEFMGLVDLFRHYRDGTLAYAGGVMDQPAYYLEAMRLIESIVNEHQGNT